MRKKSSYFESLRKVIHTQTDLSWTQVVENLWSHFAVSMPEAEECTSCFTGNKVKGLLSPQKCSVMAGKPVMSLPVSEPEDRLGEEEEVEMFGDVSLGVLLSTSKVLYNLFLIRICLQQSFYSHFLSHKKPIIICRSPPV